MYKISSMNESSSIEVDDGFYRQVSALPFSITSRYGEVVFAQGGTGYGWWPCQIYDPRNAVDPTVRQMAQKYLHTRFLVYFFNCGSTAGNSNVSQHSVSVSNNPAGDGTSNNVNAATGTVNPFSVLPPKMIKSWIAGLCEELYFGRAAKTHGKQRHRSFCDAFQLACIENDKPKQAEQLRFSIVDDATRNGEIGASTSVVAGTKELKNKEGNLQKQFLSPSPNTKKQRSLIDDSVSGGVATLKKNQHPTKVNNQAGNKMKKYHIQAQRQWRQCPKLILRKSMSTDEPHPALACFASTDQSIKSFQQTEFVRPNVNRERTIKRSGKLSFSLPALFPAPPNEKGGHRQKLPKEMELLNSKGKRGRPVLNVMTPAVTVSMKVNKEASQAKNRRGLRNKTIVETLQPTQKEKLQNKNNRDATQQNRKRGRPKNEMQESPLDSSPIDPLPKRKRVMTNQTE
jgi:hypothetical protein